MLSPDTIVHERYQIIYPVDERPGGQVYRARDRQSDQTVLLGTIPAPDAAAREDASLLAQQIAHVHHSALLELIDHFAEGDRYYFVCADPGGSDLDRALRARGGPFDEPDVLAQAIPLLEALGYLHEQRPPLYIGELWLSDIWVSQAGEWRLAPFTLTRPFSHAPSPYRPPELLVEGAEPSGATDTYAINALLYHVLTGWAPPTPEQQQAGALLTGPCSLNPKLSALMEQVLLRGLQQRPANRYQNTRELRLALETVRIMAGRSLGLGPDVIANLPLTTVGPDHPQAAPDAAAAQQAPAPPPPMAPAAALPAGPPAPELEQQGVSTGCIVGTIVGLVLVVLAICAAAALLIPGSPFRAMAGLQSAAAPDPTPAADPTEATTPSAEPQVTPAPTPTGAPAAAGGFPTPQPVELGPDAITLRNAAQVTGTVRLGGETLGPVEYSPDGELLAIVINDTISLRPPDTLEEEILLSGHTGQITTLSFAPVGDLLASGAVNDNQIRLWDVSTGRSAGTLDGHTGWIRSVAFSPDGTLLVSGSVDGIVKIWDVVRGETLHTFTSHTQIVNGVAFAPDNAFVASASRDGSLRVWDVQSGALRDGYTPFETPQLPNSEARFWTTGVAFAPDGATVAVGSIDGTVYLVDAASGDQIRQLRGHTGGVVNRGVLFSPDGATVLTASFDGTVRIWDVESGAEVGLLRGHLFSLFGIALSPDGAQLASASNEEGQLLIWDVQQQRPINSLQIGQGLITSIAFSPDGTLIGTAGYNGVVRMHDLDAQESRTMIGAPLGRQPIAFLSDEQVAAIGDQGEIVVLGVDGRSGRTLGSVAGEPLYVAATRDGRRVAVADTGSGVTLWAIAEDQPTPEIDSDLEAILTLAFSSDGSLLAGGGSPQDPRIEVWDASTGDTLMTLDQPAGGITALKFQPRGVLLAASDLRGSIWVWDARDGSVVHEIEATTEQERFISMDFSPDGTLIAAGAANGDLVFFNATSGEEVATLPLQTEVFALAFSSDGEQLALSLREDVSAISLFGLPTR